MREASDGVTYGSLSEFFATVRNASCDHVPAPAGHAPRLEGLVDEGAVGLRVREQDADPANGRWAYAENPAEVRR